MNIQKSIKVIFFQFPHSSLDKLTNLKILMHVNKNQKIKLTSGYSFIGT